MLSAEMLLHWLADVCIAGATLGYIYLVTASFLVLRFTRQRRSPSTHSAAAPVTILKPLHGWEPDLFARLASFCRQDYDGPIQIVFGTHDQADPAIDIVKRLETAFPEQPIALQVDAQEHGPNRKLSNLINMISLAQHEILIVADSDIEVGPKYLSEVVDQLQRPAIGAVTCLYHGIAGAGLWSRFSAVAINTHFLPEVVMALSFGLAQPCFGATIAMRRQTLSRIGGFSAFAEFVADDYTIGQAVRSSGCEVAIPSFSVGHVCFENDFQALLARQLRFARTIKSIDPVGYAGSIITHPLPLALLGALLGSTTALMLAGIALVGRAALGLCVERAFGLSRQHYWLIPIQDLILFVVYVASFFGATVSWRGHRYRVTSNGSFAQLEK